MNIISNIRQFPKLAVVTLIAAIAEWALTAWTTSSKFANVEAVTSVLLVLVAYGIIASNSLWFSRAQAAADGLRQVWLNLTASVVIETETSEEGDYDEVEPEWEEEDVCPECQLADEHDPECSLNPVPEEEELDPHEDALNQVEDLQEAAEKLEAAEEQTSANVPADEQPAKPEGEQQ